MDQSSCPLDEQGLRSSPGGDYDTVVESPEAEHAATRVVAQTAAVDANAAARPRSRRRRRRRYRRSRPEGVRRCPRRRRWRQSVARVPKTNPVWAENVPNDLCNCILRARGV